MENFMEMEKLKGPLRILCPAVTITTQFLLFHYPPPQNPIISNLIHISYRHLVYMSNRWEFKFILQHIHCYLKGLTFCVFYILKLSKEAYKKFFSKLISLSTLREKSFSMILVCFVGWLHLGGWYWKCFRWISSAVHLDVSESEGLWLMSLESPSELALGVFACTCFGSGGHPSWPY